MRRRLPVVLVALGVVGLLAWYVAYTQHVVFELRDAAAVQGQMYSRVYKVLLDTASFEEGRIDLAIDLAFELSGDIVNSGLPLIVTDSGGAVTAVANLPFEEPLDGPRTKAYVTELDRQNPPIVIPGVQGLHYGDSPIVRGLRIIPVMQAVGIVLLLAFGLFALLERGRADREKVWAGMAREAAHQLGTPLSALAGWLELLREEVTTRTGVRAVTSMEQDLQRLERVSHRFERIGRPSRNDEVDCAALVDRVASYFAARAPTLARTVRIVSEHPTEPLIVRGDGVLLEWVLEVLIKNAIDSLGGRDGNVVVSAEALPEGGVRIRVLDDGPGVPWALRKRIFDAGFSTKQHGWGIGLSLSRRIVHENHGGKLLLADTSTGAAFDVILPG
ncbi:MAG: HAMP domain-containing sensor histidine kinase [Gemmatimonadota bacterium]